MTVKTREKQGTSESLTTNCTLFAQEQAKETGVLDRAQIGTRRDAQAAKVVMMQIWEETTHCRRAVARKEAMEKRKVAKETAECVGTVENKTHCSMVSKGGNNKLHAIGEDKSDRK